MTAPRRLFLRAPCRACGRDYQLLTDGTIRTHRDPRRPGSCEGSHRKPRTITTEKET